MNFNCVEKLTEGCNNNTINSEDGFYILINATGNNRLPFHNIICHVNKQNDVNNDAANAKYFHHV